MLFHRARALEYMRRYQLDALVATTPVNVLYFSDYSCWLDSAFKQYMRNPGAPNRWFEFYAVFPLEGEPALVINGTYAPYAAQSWVRDLHLIGSPKLDTALQPADVAASERHILELLEKAQSRASPAEGLLSVLKGLSLSEARIGVELEGMAPETREKIARALPKASIKDCSSLIRLIRMVKSPEELARLRRAAEIGEQAGMESLALARSGVRFGELTQRYHEQLVRLCAEFDHFDYVERGLGLASATHYELRSDDVMFVDWGCIYQHYFSDTGTTLAVSEPPAELQARHAALRACMAAATDVLRAGVKASAVQAAMQQALADRGVTACRPHGHGLGLEVRDYPIIVPDNGLRIRDDCVDVPSDLTLEADMVINLEASMFLPAAGSLQIEQSFVVVPEGSRLLVEQDRTKPVRPG